MTQRGEAQIDDASRVEAMLARRWSRREPARAGVLSLLTLAFWALWIYLVAPLLTALAWFLGVRLFGDESGGGGYEDLRLALAGYATILLAIIGLLLAWIFWNVFRYGGEQDRRTVKAPDVTDSEVAAAFRVDPSVIDRLRQVRLARVDLNGHGLVVLAAEVPQRGRGASDGGSRPHQPR